MIGALLAGAVLYACVEHVLTYRPPRVTSFSNVGRIYVTQPPVDPTGRISLNTATLEELDTLPGIGKKTAESILALREHLGQFRYAEDLLLVSGIGEKKLSDLYDLIYVK